MHGSKVYQKNQILRIFVHDLTCLDIELKSSLSFTKTNLAIKNHGKCYKDDIEFYIVLLIKVFTFGETMKIIRMKNNEVIFHYD